MVRNRGRMTTELEQEFFKVFGIEPKKLKICRNINHCPNKYKICNDKCKNWHVIREDYPEITDRKLLEMICIYNSTYTNGYTNYSLLNERNIEKLKEQVLKNCLIVRDDIKLQIQQLFKEGE